MYRQKGTVDYRRELHFTSEDEGGIGTIAPFALMVIQGRRRGDLSYWQYPILYICGENWHHRPLLPPPLCLQKPLIFLDFLELEWPMFCANHGRPALLSPLVP